jgi:type I restriction enzyme S subunit
MFLSDDEANINQAVALVRVNEALIPSYLMNLLLSPRMQNEIQASKVETARPNISLEDLRLFTIPLPSPSEQQKIVEEIESRLSIANEVEKVAEQSFKQSGKLRQSILKKAFEGKLVPQDPTDEPAEKLLERIKAEKAKNRWS